MKISYKDKEFYTEKDLALSVIGGRWKIAIVWCLMQKTPLRLSEFEKMLPQANQRMLIRQLRELEEDRLVRREAVAGAALKVEYALTDIGKGLVPVVQAICDWGAEFNQFIAHLPEPAPLPE